MDEPEITTGRFTVDETMDGMRLDTFLVDQTSGFSRTQLRNAISAGEIQVDDRNAKPAYRLKAGQVVTAAIVDKTPDGPEPEDIPLDILFEDEHLAVVNKPSGMVVHPAKGHWGGTLASALAFHFSRLSSVGGTTRPGIVHRLDRDTTGVILVAKHDAAHRVLAAQFEAREVLKEYHAIVRGVTDRDRDRIVQPIGVHPYQREKMAIRANHSTTRDAITDYEVVERFRGFTLMKAFPKTGRTHQIRVHFTHVGCPILADRLYAGHSQVTRGDLLRSDDTTVILDRQALHAAKIEFTHPQSRDRMTVEAPLSSDMQAVVRLLREGL